MWLFSLLGALLLSPHDHNLILWDCVHRLGDCCAHIQRICGDAVLERCNPIWGLDKEGEINGAWRDMGVRGLWYMMGTCRLYWVGLRADVVIGIGNLALARFHSKHVALRKWFCGCPGVLMC
jgi:hypothetical protein